MNLGRIFNAINGFARDTPWLHPSSCPDTPTTGTLLFALLMLAAWWTARQAGDLHRMTAAVWTPWEFWRPWRSGKPIADAVASAPGQRPATSSFCTATPTGFPAITP